LESRQKCDTMFQTKLREMGPLPDTLNHKNKEEIIGVWNKMEQNALWEGSRASPHLSPGGSRSNLDGELRDEGSPSGSVFFPIPLWGPPTCRGCCPCPHSSIEPSQPLLNSASFLLSTNTHWVHFAEPCSPQSCVLTMSHTSRRRTDECVVQQDRAKNWDRTSKEKTSGGLGGVESFCLVRESG
jgi:hypothetical protein